ncbi:MAG: peptidylprolyl isomerase, partial [FCB group bacterium]
MEKMRKTSPYFLAAFAVLFVGFMVASDADISNLMRSGSNYQTAEIAVVNGESILYKDYEARIKEEVETRQKDSKGKDVQIDETQIRNDVWNQMIDDVIMKQEAKKAGIVVSDEDVLDVLLETPPEFLTKPFTDSLGNFNKALYLELVTNPDKMVNYLGKNVSPEQKAKFVYDFKKELINVDKYVRQQKLIDALTAAVATSSSVLSPSYAIEEFINENSKTDFSYIFFDKKNVQDFELKVSDQEIKDYYDKHKSLYTSKSQRKIKYINITISASKDDTIRAYKKVQKIADELQSVTTVSQKDSAFDIVLSEYGGTSHDFELISKVDNSKLPFLTTLKKDEVVGPIVLNDGTYFFRLDGKRTGDNESVKASHILVRFGNNKDSAKTEAEKLLQRAKGGEDFAQLAMKYSEDKSSGQNGGDLGYFNKGQMIKEFEEAAFNAKVGSIVGPVETQYGYHIIKVVA